MDRDRPDGRQKDNAMSIRKVRDLEVYRDAFGLAVEIHRLSGEFPADGYDVQSQIRRSSKSICALIAEGYGRRESPKDFRNYLRMAHGSLQETKVWLEFAQALGFVERSQARALWKAYDTLGKRMWTLAKRWQSFEEETDQQRANPTSDL